MRKFLVFFVCCSILIGCFAIPSFADASQGIFRPGDSYTFAYSLILDYPFTDDFSFSSNGLYFETMSVEYLEGGLGLVYYDVDGYRYVVYEDSTWTDDSYRFITFDSVYIPADSIRIFFTENEFYYEAGFYDTIYDLFNSAIFGGDEPSDFAEFSLTLISTVMCFGICVLPLIVIFMLLKFFLGTIARY